MQIVSSNDNRKSQIGTVLFLGFGYTARYIADILHQHQWQHLYLPTRENKMKNNFIATGFRNLGIKSHGTLKDISTSQERSNGFVVDNPDKDSLTLSDKNKAPQLQSVPAPLYTLHTDQQAEIIHPQFNNNKDTFIDSSFDDYTAQIIQIASRFKKEASYDINKQIHSQLERVTHILVTAPPNNMQDPALEQYIKLIIDLTPQLKWVGYLSATSVYGDYQGAVVTEKSECRPLSQRGKNRLNTEKLWQALACLYGTPVHIFRLSGIYGLGRSSIDAVRNQTAMNIIKENHVSNRIHVKDIANIIFASMNSPTPKEIFNITDDYPCATSEIHNYIASLLNVSQPKECHYDEIFHQLSEIQKSFYQETKIISNQKIKDMLKISLKFPSFKEGILDILGSSGIQKME